MQRFKVEFLKNGDYAEPAWTNLVSADSASEAEEAARVLLREERPNTPMPGTWVTTALYW